MKRILLLCCLLIVFIGSKASAVSLYVDAAPNVYGSTDYSTWETSTFAAVAAGNFVNMTNSVNTANVGTTNFEIEDEVVYSFGDLGKRLTWIYWIPNATISGLKEQGFSIRLENIWDGTYLDFYLDYYGSTWLEPTKWKEYNGGVIGTAGMAWWGAYGVNTQESLDADIAAWGLSDETWTFSVSLNGITSLTSHRDPVPEPATLLLLGAGFFGLACIGRKLKK